MKVLGKIHHAKRNWDCALCDETIEKGGPYRYVFPEDRKTAVHAHISCTDPILREQTIRHFAEVTGKPVEKVRKAWEERRRP